MLLAAACLGAVGASHGIDIVSHEPDGAFPSSNVFGGPFFEDLEGSSLAVGLGSLSQNPALRRDRDGPLADLKLCVGRGQPNTPCRLIARNVF